MAVHVLHYLHDGHAQWGVVADGAITPIPGEFRTTAEFIEANPVERLLLLDGPTIPESQVQWLSPVTANQQFVCQGANYRQHMIESGMDPDAKKFNMIFTKAASCIVAADSPLVKPKEVRFLDYEIELGLVLKRDITSRVTVTEENLHKFVAGAVIVNDYSARDIQIPQMQFYKGKSYRTFGPVGPYLCLLQKEEIAKLGELVLTLTVNGILRQTDTTAGLVYGPAQTLTELSGVHDLHTGDLLATGTPSGCALIIPSPEKQRAAAQLPEAEKWRLFMNLQAERTQYLKVGDVVEARIVSPDGSINLGVQQNRVVAEAP
ncbi:fumarylacetoacetate hydrolase family protein [Paraburkholderia silvatlantica]|uniref:2-keto-4-pentenoate hydratase/2-oxohepta-3-ene-1,7-dioic acid hydratase in catechol pathway n=1 Tax=Paraburkholderia silvatlantica TaxID=321895 RepID=A0A2U1AD69_9BURK|nr:fumarylacetoacetate hydrolase family protein [Paraburkholderia silvatlantica]MBB2925894.1 2-keto-4-pentenoate hydratase/2-oxohepta-3-ene-1,7-dioic acid hydratase in catechol pathway [Paraburkholderia silvatlantica]PVY33433.1 2-keto-4-pentenoate hydratase/2-oxohepta-3-ene-1,7-dioic acid hydratase in catechol pathway [Paraburkholderia silvatlantica]PXW38373.1 2-keto-4-pentenoate hydratase/2-oxohepta-3-ene-1,7-dioic acid hydratase in catechol pathway [Paraburkholderia silvatlantica]PYE27821.1 2